MEMLSQLDWAPGLSDPTSNRQAKPRTCGNTMVIDKGLGLKAYEDLLDTAAAYIDVIKLGFGTSPLYPKAILQEKIRLASQHDIHIIPGGTFLEIAVVQGAIADFFRSMNRFGFHGIEVSDGTIEMSRLLRNELITTARDQGLRVFTEYGKKMHGSKVEIEELLTTIHVDLEMGAEWVTVEGRESGIGVGFYDHEGRPAVEEMDRMLKQFSKLDKMMWEAPLKSQQVFFIQKFGHSVNLGNISPTDVLALEALRRGLRSDTMKGFGPSI
ncbi:phosphosulfolactate synthase [Marinicrinis sediminis]|uniref:Phosphosulfolactate synthase n=1 Tax=Marinicrinis sediminis TaxID=1652465 RepID=A0ABW5RDJ6_9BACL